MKLQILGIALIGLMFSACQQPVPATEIINSEASAPASFGLDSMKVIASSINKKQHTMSTLYGNSVSVNRARSGNLIQANEKLLLITWSQKPDKAWFGANIPSKIENAERLTTGNNPAKVNYEWYDGNAFKPQTDTALKNHRLSSILAMQASVMP